MGNDGNTLEMLAIRQRLIERRGDARYLIAKNAKILFDDRRREMTCTIVEMSNSGARLHPADPPTLPNSFDLVIAPGEEVTCEVVHRAELEIGVRFISQ
jgi:hypothetical protein